MKVVTLRKGLDSYGLRATLFGHRIRVLINGAQPNIKHGESLYLDACIAFHCAERYFRILDRMGRIMRKLEESKLRQSVRQTQ